VTAATLINYDPATGNLDFNPVADNLFGGWLAPAYFVDCPTDLAGLEAMYANKSLQ
jgi:hypothetical protein